MGLIKFKRRELIARFITSPIGFAVALIALSNFRSSRPHGLPLPFNTKVVEHTSNETQEQFQVKTSSFLTQLDTSPHPFHTRDFSVLQPRVECVTILRSNLESEFPCIARGYPL